MLILKLLDAKSDLELFTSETRFLIGESGASIPLKFCPKLGKEPTARSTKPRTLLVVSYCSIIASIQRS